jgi:hypothetical protein
MNRDAPDDISSAKKVKEDRLRDLFSFSRLDSVNGMSPFQEIDNLYSPTNDYSVAAETAQQALHAFYLQLSVDMNTMKRMQQIELSNKKSQQEEQQLDVYGEQVPNKTAKVELLADSLPSAAPTRLFQRRGQVFEGTAGLGINTLSIDGWWAHHLESKKCTHILCGQGMPVLHFDLQLVHHKVESTATAASQELQRQERELGASGRRASLVATQCFHIASQNLEGTATTEESCNKKFVHATRKRHANLATKNDRLRSVVKKASQNDVGRRESLNYSAGSFGAYCRIKFEDSVNTGGEEWTPTMLCNEIAQIYKRKLESYLVDDRK